MKKGIDTYTRPLLRPALISCGLSLCLSFLPAQAETLAEQTESETMLLEKLADSETEVLVELADSETKVLVELTDSETNALVELADSEEAAALSDEKLSLLLSYSLEDRTLLKELLQLRIRYGEAFTFAMRLPEYPASGCVPDAASNTSTELRPFVLPPLSGYRILPGCPLPKQAKTIQALENRLLALTETYSGNWSVYVKNLTTEESFVIQDVPMKSASVMKLFILGTVYEAIGNQELERTSEITDLITNMICDSSNEASNRLLALLGAGSYADGIAKVNSYISRHGYSSLTHEYNGFDNSDTICDSDHFNQVSASDCGKFLERVYRRELASRRVCNEIEGLMLNQHTRYKIPDGLPDGTEVGNKTGEMDTVENDAAIIYGDYSDYILCVLSNDWNSKDDAIFHIQEISSTVYDFFNDASYYQDLPADSFTQLAELIKAEQYAQYEYVTNTEEGENNSGYVTVTDEPESVSGYVVVTDESESSSGYVMITEEEAENETEFSSENTPLSMSRAFPLLKESGAENAD